MAWILVTPSSRGIGHALTRHLLKTTPASVPIIATGRKDHESVKESILSDLQLDDTSAKRLDIQTCDLMSEQSIADLAGYCKDRYQKDTSSKSDNPSHLRLMFGLPGLLHPEKSPQQIDHDKALETLQLNLLSPMMLVKHFTPFLPKKKTKLAHVDGLPDAGVMALMSARVGSVSDNSLGGWYSYRASKAGVNQLVKSTDIYQKMQSAENACVVGLHPGTVKTGLSKEFWNNVKPEKLFEPDFAADKLVGVVEKVGGNVSGMRGKCWDWKGEEVPP